MILKGDRIVVPKSLRKGMLNQIHQGHLGEVKCKARARGSVYWPGISTDISNVVATCHTCSYHRNAQSKQPLKPHESPEYPFQKVGTDLFSLGDKPYLVVVDYFSSYPEIVLLTKHNTGSNVVVNALKDIFSRFGVPETVFSDNGPQYNSQIFLTLLGSGILYMVRHRHILHKVMGVQNEWFKPVKSCSKNR